MPNKKSCQLFVSIFVFAALCSRANADLELSAVSVDDYEPAGSLFQMIADLEQEKIVLQLEKEKAQLQLDMDRLAAEQTRIRNEMDAMSGAGNTQSEAIELERQRLELERDKLEAQRKNLEAPTTTTPVKKETAAKVEESSPMAEKYRLIEIIGAGRQLFATVEEVSSGQRKKISVGKTLDDYRVDSVSLDEGVVLSRDGETAILGIRSIE
ncbi:MAG: type IV pilus biogenesis protein PilP [Alphaproteobacteria bacterium]|nr:type IV pilus biogenesis protein PilP [Alphaproteobacteria bacterium]